MDIKHFDAWTCHRFGLAAGSAVVAFFALRHLDAALCEERGVPQRIGSIRHQG